MAYYDPTWGSWHAVPSTLAADRRSVTAVVHHLSLWTDITGSIGAVSSSAAKSLSDAADWGYYQIGKTFDTRVDPPNCTGKPSWLRSSVFIQRDRNNPLNFCVGSDPKNSSLVDVKVNVNRGYAFNARINSATTWQYNSTFQGQSLHDVIAAVGHLDQDVSKTWNLFVPPGSILVEPGKQLSFGATNQQIVGMGNSSTVLSLAPPTPLSFLVSTLGQLVGTQLQLMVDGYASAVIAVAGCYSDVLDATTSGAWAQAANTCLGSLDEAAAKHLATYLTKRGWSPKEAGGRAGSVMGKISIYLALVGPVFSTMNFVAEQATPQSARTVDLYPSVGAGAPTHVSYVWPSVAGGWRITQRSDDPCKDTFLGGSSVGPSGFATRPGEFSCGSSADSLLVCKASGSTVTCIANFATKEAVQFQTSEPTNQDFPAANTPEPLQATLTNGTVCDWISHDQTQHYRGQQSWLWCGFGPPVRALLVNPEGSYFDKTHPQWTAQYGIGTDPPSTVGVKSVVYAG